MMLNKSPGLSSIQSLDYNTPVFLELVRAGLWGKEVRLSRIEEVDFLEIYREAVEQSVVGLVAVGLEQVKEVKVPQDVIFTFVGGALRLERRNVAVNQFIAKLIDELRTAGIYTLLLKGQGVAQCYERSLWRACGDVDLFLSKENYDKAKKFLLPLSTTSEKEYKREQHLGMTIDNWVVELHGSLRCGLSRKIDRNLDEIKNDIFCGGNVRSWMNGNTQVFLPGVNEDAVFIFTHFLQHFYKEGLGLRQICDWCRLLWTYRDSLDYGLLETRIRKMGLMSEWRAFGAFAVEYLGMPSEVMPMYSPDAKWKRKADKICAFILEVGNMGHNRGSWLMEHDSWFSRLYVVRKVFSMGRRCGDIIRHARIFPLDSLRFFPYIMYNGIRSAVRGE